MKSAAMLALAAVLLAGATYRLIRFLLEQRAPVETAFFYDLSARTLFVAPRTQVPPIRGVDNEEADGMRAIVVSPDGNPNDTAGRKVAYLEKYAPELKAQLESMQSGQADAASSERRIGRGEAQSFTFVCRPEERIWHPVNSPEGEKIMTEWQVPGPDGRVPVVCVP